MTPLRQSDGLAAKNAVRASSDMELVRAVLADERGAVALLIERYQNLVRRIVFRLVDDPRDRDEVCQNVFVHAVRAMASFRAEAKLATWIGRIAYREGLQLHRRTRDRTAGVSAAVELDELPSGGPGPLADAERKELESLVIGAVRSLPVEQKTAVTLFYLEGMSVAEIADVMGMPENTVKSHLLRARQRLRVLLIAEAREHGYAV